MKKLGSLLLCWLFLGLCAGFAQVQVARIFGDHAVLQREKPIPVWGWAKPKEKITVSLAGQTQTASAGADGKWLVKFKPMAAGTGYLMTIKSVSGTLSFSDIAIGEVWLCSGQSNMEWKVNQTQNASEEKNKANFSAIRQFYVPHELSLSPEKDLKKGDWVVCSPQTVGDFTAVGYFFARELYQKMNVPVGLIHSSWGGSHIEGWLSYEALASSPDLQSFAKNYPKIWADAKPALDRRLKKAMFGNPEAQITAEEEKKYTEKDYDYTAWNDFYPPASWDWQGCWAFRGRGYAAKTIEIPADAIEKVSYLGIGQNDSPSEAYINGKLVWQGAMKGSRKIEIPANTWQVGKNTLVLKFGAVIEPDWMGLGMFGAGGDYYLQTNSQRISLESAWKIRPALTEPYQYLTLQNNVASTLYNAMIQPLVPYAIQGVLWYQGESNADRAFQYRSVFPLMIEDWRKKWGNTFSFLFVQLSSYGSSPNSNQGSSWAELREAQTMTLSLPNTGMAVTTDIGNPQDIHPINKQDVGKRLAAWALKNTYKQDLPYASPMFDKMEVLNEKATISFKLVGKGLTIKDQYGYLKGFEVAGEDKVFYFAKAELTANNQVIVSHPKRMKIVAVRYGWTDSAHEINLFSLDGFPVCPFRTDSWKGITEANIFD